MDLSSSEIRGLKEIFDELNENIAHNEKRKETGNSRGENKDIYRSKFEVYSRCRVVLYRYFEWHSVIEVLSDGNYNFLKKEQLTMPDKFKDIIRFIESDLMEVKLYGNDGFDNQEKLDGKDYLVGLIMDAVGIKQTTR